LALANYGIVTDYFRHEEADVAVFVSQGELFFYADPSGFQKIKELCKDVGIAISTPVEMEKGLFAQIDVPQSELACRYFVGAIS
jgi:hypothetical protein